MIEDGRLVSRTKKRECGPATTASKLPAVFSPRLITSSTVPVGNTRSLACDDAAFSKSHSSSTKSDKGGRGVCRR